MDINMDIIWGLLKPCNSRKINHHHCTFLGLLLTFMIHSQSILAGPKVYSSTKLVPYVFDMDPGTR